VIRPGFSTHAMNMGQRFVQLDSSYTGNTDGSGVLHVSQLPPNPAILAPGPAWIFVVVNGVPSVGVQVMCGSGKIEKQTMLAIASLPAPSLPQATSSSGSGNGNGGGNAQKGQNKNAASTLALPPLTGVFLLLSIALGVQTW